MMVPSDARIFFNDVLKGGISPDTMAKSAQPAQPADAVQPGQDNATADEDSEADDPKPQKLTRKAQARR
jgi:hypothetical protein